MLNRFIISFIVTSVVSFLLIFGITWVLKPPYPYYEIEICVAGALITAQLGRIADHLSEKNGPPEQDDKESMP